MQRSNLSRYLSEDGVLGFLASDDSEEEEISDSDWIYTDDDEEDTEEISLCDSSSEEEMDDQLRFSASANYFVPKPKRGKQHLWQIMLIVQLQLRATCAATVFIRQSPGSTTFAKFQSSKISDTFTLFLWSSLRKIMCHWTNHEGVIAYGSLRKLAYDEEFKVFLGVVILIDVYESNNENVA